MRSSSKARVVAAAELPSTTARWSLVNLDPPKVVNNAPKSAEELRREAEEHARLELERQLADAHAAGYEAGRLDGELAEATRLRNAIAAAEAALDCIRENDAKWQASVCENISALAVAVARHVIAREVTAGGTLVADLVRKALAEFPIDQPMRVRVNPHDLSLLSRPQSEGEDVITIAPSRDVRWLADARIEPGGCVVEGRERIVDGRVDTALERIYRLLSTTDA